MARAAAASSFMPAAARHDVLEVGFSAARAHQVIPIDRCPVLAKSLDGALKAAWAIAELLEPAAQAARHSCHRDRYRARYRRARLGPVDSDGNGGARPARRFAQSGAAHPPWRVDRAGAAADNSHGIGDRAVAARGLSTGHSRRRSGAGATGPRYLRHRRSERKARPICSPASARSRCGSPNTMRVTAADDDEAALAALARAGNTTGLKPVTTERRDLFKNPFLAAELNRFDAVVFDPPRQGAQAQSREIAASRVPVDCGGVVQSRHLRPRCADPDRRRLPADIASHPSTNSAIPRTSSWWPGSRNSAYSPAAFRDIAAPCYTPPRPGISQHQSLSK